MRHHPETKPVSAHVGAEPRNELSGQRAVSYGVDAPVQLLGEDPSPVTVHRVVDLLA